ncbi:MAG: hypothetical protein GX676_03205 [Bacilli bacterium]|nr:hypothetical protein [Bacilli bacterium]
MGYYILGIIILLLLIVFISDLLREARGGDKFYRNISNPYPGEYDFYHEFAEENDFDTDEEEYLLEKDYRYNKTEDLRKDQEKNNTEEERF